MEEITKLLKQKISEQTLNENISPQKLRDLLDIYERLINQNINSIVQLYDNTAYPVVNHVQRESSSYMFDSLKETFQEYFKNISNKSNANDIDNLIQYYSYLNKISESKDCNIENHTSIKKECNNLKNEIIKIVIHKIKSKIHKTENYEKQEIK